MGKTGTNWRSGPPPQFHVFERDVCVFLNCPFDEEYRPKFDRLTFATVCAGFIPRCALESEQVSEPRINRIRRSLKGSKYSIHDLFRCHGSADENLARFNMPLELGMAMGERFDGGGEDWHDWLVLCPVGHPHGKYISDLQGYDPKYISLEPDEIIAPVTSWLSIRQKILAPSPDEVLDALPEFLDKVESLRKAWRGNEAWWHIVDLAANVAAKAGFIG